MPPLRFVHTSANHLQPRTISRCENVCVSSRIMCIKPQSKQQSGRRVRCVGLVTRFFGELWPSVCRLVKGKERLIQMLWKQQRIREDQHESNPLCSAPTVINQTRNKVTAVLLKLFPKLISFTVPDTVNKYSQGGLLQTTTDEQSGVKERVVHLVEGLNPELQAVCFYHHGN